MLIVINRIRFALIILLSLLGLDLLLLLGLDLFCQQIFLSYK